MVEPLQAVRGRLVDLSARALADAVLGAVRDGDLPPGTRLPPIRAMARDLMMSPTTVSSAWAILRRFGAISTDGRRGSLVAARRTEFGQRYGRAFDRHVPVRLDLSTGMPDPELLPDPRRVLAMVTGTGAAVSYLDDPVLPELAGLLRRGWPYPVRRVTVTDGVLDALELLTRVAVPVGSRVVVEDPGYPPLLEMLEAAGARVVGVPLDREGMRPDALAAALAEPVAMLVVQPRAQNPMGVSMSARRRDEIARILGRSAALVVEDDSAGAIASAPLVSFGTVLPERTVHVRGFAKSYGPDLRLAAVAAPEPVMRAMVARRRLGQGWSSRLLQQVLYLLLTDAETTRRVQHARRVYRERRVWLAAALAARGVDIAGVDVAGADARGDDGINLWLPVVDEAAAVAYLAERGIGVAAGSAFSTGPGGPVGVRVTCGLVPVGEVSIADRLAGAARAAH